MERINVNGTILHYRQHGDGEPLVFVHGSVADHRAFEQQFSLFSSGFHVITYSRRYHPPNQAPGSDEIYAARDHMDDLLALMDQLAPSRRIRLVASSYGAYVSLLFALRHPARVAALVLGEPPMLRLLEWTTEGIAALAGFRANALEPSRVAFEKGDMEEGLRRFVCGVRGDRDAFDRLPSFVREGLLKFGPEMNLEMTAPFDEYMPVVTPDELRNCPVPALLVTGEESPAFFHIITEQLALSLPNTERVAVPRAGHTMNATNPAAYNDAVLSFLIRHS